MILNAQLKSTNQSMCHNINDTPQILHAYWADKDGKLIKFPSYNSRLVYICIITNKEAVGKDYDISFFHMANGKIEKVCMNIDNIVINSTKMLVPIPFDEKIFKAITSNIIDVEFYLLKKGGNKRFYFKNQKLKIHAVIFIWEIMEHMGWYIGAKTQHRWFKTPSCDKPYYYFDIENIIKFDDVLKYRPINDLYNKLIEDKVWFTSNAQKQLVDEIRKMLIMGHASLPNNIIKESHFGNFENKLITSFWQKKQITQIDEYYIQYQGYIQPKILEVIFSSNRSEIVNELYASLGDFRIRIAVMGSIQTTNKEYYKINIKKVAFYIIDSFDFIDNTFFSQPLGLWDIVNKKIVLDMNIRNAHYITNSDYNDYRHDTGIGQDYIIYSDVKEIATSDSFFIHKNVFSPNLKFSIK